ncbi:MAG: FHA domain-containing protein [Ardenticatenaceae bacterium]|nr:FHA domain-containing protein [Ardenticatenaceae bacterium]
MNNKPVLIIREGQLVGQRWTIEESEFLIGRGGECDLILPERQVSRHHVRITRENDRYILHDLGSKNGTHVNGQQLHGSVTMKDGDQIQIAMCVTMMFVGTEATLPLTWEEPVKTGRMVLHEELRNVSVSGQALNPPLSLAQFRLLKLLYDADGAVCERQNIVDTVWPGTDGIGVTEQAIDALVRRLRDRLSELDDHNFVVTVRGHGFRLDNPLN